MPLPSWHPYKNFPPTNNALVNSFSPSIGVVGPEGKMREYGMNPLSPAEVCDTYWSKVTLCINPAGESGSTVITDAKGKVISVYGDTKIDTSLGYPAILFDGASDLIAVGDISGLSFGSEDFTIDLHVRKIANVAASSILWNPDGDVYNDVALSINGSGNLACYMSSNGSSWNMLSAPNIAALANGVDYFIRIVRSGGTALCGINGTQYVLTTSLGTTSLYSHTSARVIGGQSTGTNRSLNGYIRGVRITKGIARGVLNVDSLPFPTR